MRQINELDTLKLQVAGSENLLTEYFFNGFSDFKGMISNITQCSLNIAVPYSAVNEE